MNYLTKVQKSIAFVVIGVLLLLISFTTPVYAETEATDGTTTNQSTVCNPDIDPTCKDPALDCGASGSGDCGIFDKYINPLIVFLSAFVGVAVTIGLIYWGIQYSSAGSDPNAVSKARNTIKNSLVALITFLFLLAIMNWLVPGGLAP